MLSKKEFTELVKDKNIKLRVNSKAYKLYTGICKLINDQPEEIDKLINSSKEKRQEYRVNLANSLIETTPEEVEELIDFITLIREEL